jgi:hypothetical protein
MPVTRNAAWTVPAVNALRYAFPKSAVKSPFPAFSPLAFSKSLKDLLPDLLHSCKANDVETLKRMRAMRRVTKNHNVVLERKPKELWCVVGAVTIQEEHACTSTSFVLGLCAKVFN